MESTLPLHSLNPPVLTINEFNFGQAFRGEDLLIVGDEDAYTSGTMSDSSRAGCASATLASNNSLVEVMPRQTLQQKQRLERRGHTKSRRGCFNCKRRRIKCQETRPSCGHCVKTGLTCEYPSTPTMVHQRHDQIPLFSLQDMRFFQHFMMKCYPHHPIGNENIWTHEVPCLSQSHEFLMHAILGLGACDLMHSDPSLLVCVMDHRMKAIRAIKKSLVELSKDEGRATTPGHANALVATCFALTFQSVTFEDGMAEYMIFIRGILIVGAQMWVRGIKPIFANMIAQSPGDVLEPKMSALPLIRAEWANGAVEAIRGLWHLCRDAVEIEYHEIISDMAQKLRRSSWEAYKTLQKHYGWWIQLKHEKFQRVIDMRNQTMVLLASHWIAVKQIMTSITNAEHECREKSPPPPPPPPPQESPAESVLKPGTIRWLTYLNRQVDDEHIGYNRWPMWVEDQLNRNVTVFGKKY